MEIVRQVDDSEITEVHGIGATTATSSIVKICNVAGNPIVEVHTDHVGKGIAVFHIDNKGNKRKVFEQEYDPYKKEEDGN